MATLNLADKELIITTINNGPIKVQALSREDNRVYDPGPGDISALIKRGDGSLQKVEFFYGSGYLSQSSRILPIPDEAVSVLILDTEGKETEILPLP
jgi:hypothetical protein